MPNYKEMYQILFRETSKAIATLQKAQQQTEEMYMADDVADNLIVISQNTKIARDDEGNHPPQG